MTKNEYLELKQIGSIEIIYNYYKERFNKDKHRPFLALPEFSVYLAMYMDVPRLFEKVSNHYDRLFDVMVLKDKNGNFICFL